MKLHKRLTVNGAPVLLHSDDIRLDLFNPGRAVFDIESDTEVKGLVVFSAAYDPNALQQVFYGFVENTFHIDKKQQRVFCRELCATMNRLMPVNLRNVNIADVLRAVAKETGLQFVTPDQPYTKKTAPAFYSMNSGYSVMDSFARVFDIPQFMWQQQGDGKVYVGSWHHSFWAGRDVVLPVEIQASSGLANNARIPCNPRLRPGVLFRSNFYITKVHWDGEHQNIQWDKNPWGTRWTNRSSV